MGWSELERRLLLVVLRAAVMSALDEATRGDRLPGRVSGTISESESWGGMKVTDARFGVDGRFVVVGCDVVRPTFSGPAFKSDGLFTRLVVLSVGLPVVVGARELWLKSSTEAGNGGVQGNAPPKPVLDELVGLTNVPSYKSERGSSYKSIG